MSGSSPTMELPEVDASAVAAEPTPPLPADPLPHRPAELRFEDALLLARAGDQDAFAELWRRMHPPLLRYLRVVAGAPAEDVASQTWVKVIGALPRFAGDENSFRAWLFTIGRRTHLDELRRRGARPEWPSPAEELAALVPSGEDVCQQTLDRLAVAEALAVIRELPADQAELIMLRVVAGLDVAEVAAIVGRSPGAVRVGTHRALRRLRDRLEPALLDAGRRVPVGVGARPRPALQVVRGGTASSHGHD